MSSFRKLLCALTLSLLALAAEAWSDGNLAGAELTDLFNSPVHQAERVFRPKGSSSSAVGPLGSHSGVKVTLDDGSQWLIHKGPNYGTASDTVVTSADHMSPRWTTRETRDFNGEKNVADFVRTGGATYNLLRSNCHQASRRMMDQ